MSDEREPTLKEYLASLTPEERQQFNEDVNHLMGCGDPDCLQCAEGKPITPEQTMRDYGVPMSDRKVFRILPDGQKVFLVGLHALKKGDVFELHPADDDNFTEVTQDIAFCDGFINAKGAGTVSVKALDW